MGGSVVLKWLAAVLCMVAAGLIVDIVLARFGAGETMVGYALRAFVAVGSLMLAANKLGLWNRPNA